MAHNLFDRLFYKDAYVEIHLALSPTALAILLLTLGLAGGDAADVVALDIFFIIAGFICLCFAVKGMFKPRGQSNK